LTRRLGFCLHGTHVQRDFSRARRRAIPRELKKAWRRLSRDLDIKKLDLLTEEISLSQAIERAALVLQGKIRGRIVVDTNR
jgi:NADPH:quinone reductase-like Zn-dependent oxidoreductase